MPGIRVKEHENFEAAMRRFKRVVEKSGVLNLGVEGMMITGAVIGFIFAVNTETPIYGFICAAIAGALLSVLFAVLTQYIMSNQVATGLGLTMVGLGLSEIGRAHV